MRLFYAVTFDDITKSQLATYIDKVSDVVERGRFTRTENIHLTLEFIGEVKGFELNRYMSYLDELSDFPTALTITGLGRFDKRGKDILWLKLAKNQALINLQKQLLQVLEADGFKSQYQKFTPHITLGRQIIMKQDTDIIKIEPMTVKIKSVALMESKREHGILVYTPLDEIEV